MSDLIGKKFGDYRVIEMVGAGGMATVYQAHQASVDRLVAIKVMPQALATDTRFVERFQREAQIIAKLEHPNIIPVYEFGQQDGMSYLVMRYLQAGTIKELLEQQNCLSLSATSRILTDIAAALDHAHTQSIVHRDVKPGNILVDKEGNAYLTDFGIAKALEGTADLTGSGMLGTPAYMAPEQTLGQTITAQTDVYSLGVMIYEMLTGRLPFQSDTPMSLAIMHVSEPVPRPSEFNPALPGDVENVLLKALAKDPAQRYSSAGEFARKFDEVAKQHEGEETQPLTLLAAQVASRKTSEAMTQAMRTMVRRRETVERQHKLLRLAPWGIGIAAAVCLVASLAFVWSNTTQTRLQAERTAAAVSGLSNQVSAAQTAAASGGAEAQATLQLLQTKAASTPSLNAEIVMMELSQKIKAQLKCEGAQCGDLFYESTLASFRVLETARELHITLKNTSSADITLPSLWIEDTLISSTILLKAGETKSMAKSHPIAPFLLEAHALSSVQFNLALCANAAAIRNDAGYCVNTATIRFNLAPK